MPLEYQRLVVTGERHQRDVSQKCNAGLDAVGIEIDALKARVDLLEFLMLEAQVSAQGAMAQTTDASPYPDITGAFQPITFYDTITMAVRLCTLDTSTGQFTLTREGKWLLLFQFNASHNNTGASRSTNIRLFNVTDATASSPVQVETPGQSASSGTMLFLPLTITSGTINKSFRFEIGGGSTYTAVVWNTATFGAFYQDRFGTLLAP